MGGCVGGRRRVYRGTASRDVRRDLFHALANSTGRELMREVADAEKDPDLCARYGKVLATEQMAPMALFAALCR